MLRTTTSTSLLDGLRDPDNSQVWGLFVDRYRPLVLRFALRLGLTREDAEDVAQTTLLEFSTSYGSGAYARDRGRLRSWLFGIARNQVRDWHRRRPAAEVSVPQDELARLVEDAGDPGGLVAIWDREWNAAILRQCVEEVRGELRPETIEAFELFAIQELPTEEVGARLGMTTNAVWLAKRRVIQRIRNILPMMEEVW